MKVSVNQENLAKGLSIVGRAVAPRSTLPVLGNVLLEATGGQLRLSATNLEIGVNCWIAAQTTEDGAITVPARLLADFVNSLPPERIDMELIAKTMTLHLDCARYDANIKGIVAVEFPIVPTLEQLTEKNENQPDAMPPVTLDAGKLGTMIAQVAFAAATDESRPTLTGIECTFHHNRLTMAATDGYRLSVRSEEIDFDGERTLIVPARSLSELERVMKDGGDTVQMAVAERGNQLCFSVDGKEDAKGSFRRVDVVSSLIDARFPSYQNIIPKSHTTRTIVDTKAFLGAVRVANLFARDNANIVRLKVLNGDTQAVRLTATSAEMGDGESEITAQVTGDEIEIAFDARYLQDILSRVGSEQVDLRTTEPNRPGMFVPVGMTDTEFQHILMPLHPPKN